MQPVHGVPTEGSEALATIALETAREAAELIRPAWRTRPEAGKKARTDLVTEYDLQSERLIRERLRALTPDVGIVGEEEGAERVAGAAWYCDPLDGTTNFVHGHPIWCVSIGLVAAGRPLAGAVVAPCIATEWQAWSGTGGAALRNGEPCRVSDTASVSEALVATGFPPERETSPYNNFSSFEAVKKRVRAVRRCGSAAIDLCFVADGTYDAYWERRVHIWDLAGGAAVLAGAGGRMTALDGGAPQLEVGHILASNGQVHDALRVLIPNPEVSGP